MPFRKRNVRRVRRRFKPRSAGVKALHMVRKMKKNLSVEKKLHTIAITGTIPTTGLVFNLADVAQGDTLNLRDGNQMKVIYVGGRIQFTQNASATQTFVRYIVFRDLQQVASTIPPAASILQSLNTNSFLNQDNLGRFRILVDKTITLSSAGSTLRYVRVNLPMSSSVRYNGTAATDLQKNGLYIMVIASEATNLPSLTASMRIRFVDN